MLRGEQWGREVKEGALRSGFGVGCLWINSGKGRAELISTPKRSLIPSGSYVQGVFNCFASHNPPSPVFPDTGAEGGNGRRAGSPQEEDAAPRGVPGAGQSTAQHRLW